MIGQSQGRLLTYCESRAVFNNGAAVALAIQCDGRLSPVQFQRAVRRLEETCPTFNSRILYNSSGKLCFFPLPTPLSARMVAGDSSEAVGILNEELSIPFDVSFGPLLRIALVQSESSSEIILVAHPAATDGRGIVNAMAMLLSWASGDDIEDASENAMCLDSKSLGFLLHGKENSAHFGPGAIPTAASRLLWKLRPFRMPDMDNAEIRALQRPDDAAWQVGSISSEDINDIYLLAEGKKASLECFFAASLIWAGRRAGFEDDCQFVNIAFDLREMLGSSAISQVAPMSLDSTVAFQYDGSDSFWNNTIRLRDAIEQKHAAKREIEKAFYESAYPPSLLEAEHIARTVQSMPERFHSKGFASLGEKSQSVAARLARKTLSIEGGYTVSVVDGGILSERCDGVTVKPIAFVEAGMEYGIRLSTLLTDSIAVYSIQGCEPKLSDSYMAMLKRIKREYAQFITHDAFYCCVNSIRQAPAIFNGLADGMLLLEN